MAQPLRIKTDTDERIYNTEAYFLASPIIWTPSQTLIPIDGSNAGKRKVGNNADTYTDLSFEGGGTGGASAWGEITGTLSDQTDLQAALDAKADSSDLTGIDAPTATFSTNTNTAQDPGQDTVRFNSGTIGSVTEIALSDVVGGVDKGTLNSLCSGIIQFRLVGTTETIEFRITSVVHTSWTRYTVTYLKGALPANGTVMSVRFIPVNVVTQTITNGETTTSPSEDAVFDALAGKADLPITNTAAAPTAVLCTITGVTDGNGRLGVDFTAASGGRPAFSAVYFLGGGPTTSGADLSALVHAPTLAVYSVQYWDVPGATVAAADIDVSFTVLGIPV